MCCATAPPATTWSSRCVCAFTATKPAGAGVVDAVGGGVVAAASAPTEGVVVEPAGGGVVAAADGGVVDAPAGAAVVAAAGGGVVVAAAIVVGGPPGGTKWTITSSVPQNSCQAFFRTTRQAVSSRSASIVAAPNLSNCHVSIANC